MKTVTTPSSARRARAALSLIEVMVAMAIFFMCVFAILGMVSNNLRNARALQVTHLDAGALAAFLTLSNRLDEGTYSGDFGDLFPDHEYSYEVIPITNGLVRVDLLVRGEVRGGQEESTMSILLFLANQPAAAPGIGLRR